MNEQRFHLDEINPRSVIRDLIQNCWVPVLLALTVWFAVSAYGKLTYTPKYTSEATFVVTSKGSADAYSSLSLTSNMADVFSEVFQSDTLRKQVEKQVTFENPDWYITTNIIAQTNLMTVRIVSSSPEQSFLALKAVIDIYPEISQLMFENAVLQVLKDPRVPTAPSNSSDINGLQKKLALVAFAAGIAGVIALSVLRDTVQTAPAAKRKLDGRLLNTVRHEEKNKTLRAKRSRKNIAPLISHPFISQGFREDYQNLSSKMEYHMRKRGQKVILISSAGENEGKSTVAANLALSLAEQDKKVALLDCDFRKPALHKIFTMKADKQHDFGRFLSHSDAQEDVLYDVSKLKIHLAINASRHKYPQRLITSERMDQLIRSLRKRFDYVILDTPPMLVASDAEALAAWADVAVLVVREDWIMTRSINDSLDTLRRATPDTAGFVLNNCYMKQKGLN